MATNDYDSTDTTSNTAAPNHGIDGNSSHDPAKGGVIGAVGGAVVGGLAGGPIGAVIGAVVGGVASDVGVAAVDKHDNDNSPNEAATTYGSSTDYAATSAPYAATTNSAAYVNAPTAATPMTRDSYAADGGAVIPVVEEELVVGKREVERGGVRIVQSVETVPVEEQVSLHEEHVNVERRVVDRAISGSDLTDAFQEGTMELTETAEVPVISKEARVVEEIVIGKSVTDRTETVKDTVRRSDVEIEELPGSTRSMDTDSRR